jgi:hypothetical protein
MCAGEYGDSGACCRDVYVDPWGIAVKALVPPHTPATPVAQAVPAPVVPPAPAATVTPSTPAPVPTATPAPGAPAMSTEQVKAG